MFLDLFTIKPLEPTDSFASSGNFGGPVFTGGQDIGENPPVLLGLLHSAATDGSFVVACKIQNIFNWDAPPGMEGSLILELAGRSGVQGDPNSEDYSRPMSLSYVGPTEFNLENFQIVQGKWTAKGGNGGPYTFAADPALPQGLRLSPKGDFSGSTGYEGAWKGNVTATSKGQKSAAVRWTLTFRPRRWVGEDLGTPPDVTVEAGVGAVSAMDTPTVTTSEHVYAFVRGSDGHLWMNWTDLGAWHWDDRGTPTPGVTVAAGVGVVTASQRPHAFVLGSDGHLWMNWTDLGASHWDDRGIPTPGVTIAAGVGVVTVANTPSVPERPHAFVVGSDGHLWRNGSAGNWDDRGTPTPGVTVAAGVGVVTVMDTPTASQRPYAFVLGSDEHLWVNWFDDTKDWQWTDLGTPFRNADVLRKVGAVTGMVTPTAPQRPFAFVRGNDGRLWANWWNGSTWKWEDHGMPPSNGLGGTSVAAEVGVLTVAWPSGGMKDNSPTAFEKRPFVFVRGSDGHLWVNWWGGVTQKWDRSDQGIASGGIAAGVGAVTTNPEPDRPAAQWPNAFVRSGDGHLWFCYPSDLYFDAEGNSKPPV